MPRIYIQTGLVKSVLSLDHFWFTNQRVLGNRALLAVRGIQYKVLYRSTTLRLRLVSNKAKVYC